MPCFSFSAPAVSPEEERREREELGAEYQQIQDEMRGRRALPKQLNAQVGFQCSVEDVQTEMAKMPDSEKTHLLQAMECAPSLVEKESNHLLYHANCQSHKEVTSCLATYWRLRCQIFASKAFLPMKNLASEEKLESSTFVKVLPNDRADRPVLFFDRIEVYRATATRSAAMKHLFIALHMLCEEAEARKSGFVFIENMCGFDLYTDFDRILTKTQMSLLRDCFPTQLRCYHLCGGIDEKWAVDLVVPVLKQIARKSIRLRMVCHTASPHDIATILDDEYMIKPSTLPRAISGRHETVPFTNKKHSAKNQLEIQSKVHEVHVAKNHRFAQKIQSSCPLLKNTLAENWAIKNGLDCRQDALRR
ncbi:unnamed protein product [Cylindrotheca closterium]|uniref:CRAL-TRIO domain-containing protein n=1 Tax=Cylindrotheca closterium TaxID=2856 RepID=A0AAD2PUS7_9STRA|nr:unnamed protein product [Cylindrotheca closterium]